MGVVRKIRRALRGDVEARTLALEALRRSRAARVRRRERAMLESLATRPVRLSTEFARLSPHELLEHFRKRLNPKFLPGCDATSGETANLQRSLFTFETTGLLERATRIREEHSWPILGFGEKHFGAEINWLRDPLSGATWPLDYHADISLARGDGSDARVLWELNRLAHLITLARASVTTGDEKFAESAFRHLASWREQNPLGRGPNWACAMEVALRAMNLLATLELLRGSAHLNEETLLQFLQTLDQHGAHILRNLEFSYITTSNHYLSDVVGLLWLGVMLPELEAARSWREFGLRETLREMDKQILADGADSESSTGYHRLVLELFLYSFILCRANQIGIEEKYWDKLRAMLDYMSAYLRPDGRAPLIGDTDSGQILPLVKREADDHAYLLALGAVLFNEPRFKHPVKERPEELLWVLGASGVSAFENLPQKTNEGARSRAFRDAGTYVLRKDDLYLLFNASESGLKGRGSHGHNDALSVEVSACGTSFITDPGTYVYTAALKERHLFRSTAYHSTVEVDGREQNSTDPLMPFVIGNEAQPRVTRWETSEDRDLVVGEHAGYARLPLPVIHQRTVEFHKRERYWVITDLLSTRTGGHTYRFRFHFASGLEVSVRPDQIVRACDKIRGARLLLAPLWLKAGAPVLEENFTSRDYGARERSRSACWTAEVKGGFEVDWLLIPVCPGEDEEARARLIAERLDEIRQQAQLDEE